MAETARKTMTVDEFFLWQQDQEDRFELIEGFPVKMMTGASTNHDRVVTNIIISLGNQLRGTPCRPATADVALRTKIRSIRRPDVTVTCDPPALDVYEARDAKMVVEVLSPSNTGVTWQRKIEEYRRCEGLIYILFVDSRVTEATLLTRSAGGWEASDAEGPSAVIDLPQIGCRLAMSDVYEGVTL